MNILFLGYNDRRIVSGGYRYNIEMVSRLGERGHTIDCVGPDNFTDNIIGGIQGKKYDIILEDALTHPSFFLLNKRIKNISKAPLISLLHSVKSISGREQAYLQTVDAYITTSNTTQKEVQAITGMQKPACTIYPGRDTYQPKISPRTIEQRLSCNPVPVILFAGNIIPQKGLDSLIEALHLLPDTSWRLDIAGDETIAPSFTGKIKRKIRRYGLQTRATFLGLLSRWALAEKYNQSNILAMPSWHEGLGMVYMEGMSFGLAILAAENGGATELISQMKHGFLVHPRQTKRIASYLDLLLHNRLFLVEMGMNAYQRHLEFPTWKESAGKLENFLKAAIPAA